MSRPMLAAASRDAHLTLRRVERHQRLVELLCADQRSWPAPELARRLGVAVRTVERDLERLRQTGLPLVSRPGRGGGVRLDVVRGTRTVHLDAAEIAALLASLTALGPTATTVAASATRALVTALTGPPERPTRGAAPVGSLAEAGTAPEWATSGTMPGMDDPDPSTPLTRAQAQEAVQDIGWRLLLGELVTVVPLDSLAEGAGLLAAVTVELGSTGDAHLRADLRPDHLRLTVQDRARGVVTAADVALAERVTAVLDRPVAPVGDRRVGDAQELEIAIDALDIPAVLPFWAAALALVPSPDDPGEALVDPAGRLPAVWFQQMDAERPQRNRIHLDITVPHDVAEARVAAALAAGGRLLSDAEARAFWVLADVEGNEVCVCTWQDRDR